MIPTKYDPRFDYYSVLKVTPSATPSEIKVAFYRAVREVHPDLNRQHKRSTRRTQRINEAKILLHPSKRAEYDFARAEYWTTRPAPTARKKTTRTRATRRRVSRPAESPAGWEAELGDLADAWVRIAEGFLRGLRQA